MRSTIELLREARSSGVYEPALDHLLELGYTPRRALVAASNERSELRRVQGAAHLAIESLAVIVRQEDRGGFLRFGSYDVIDAMRQSVELRLAGLPSAIPIGNSLGTANREKMLRGFAFVDDGIVYAHVAMTFRDQIQRSIERLSARELGGEVPFAITIQTTAIAAPCTLIGDRSVWNWPRGISPCDP